MNTEERQLLSRFLQDLTQSQGGMKDAEAASLIDQTVRSNPDAAYVLVQHAIIADQALHAAQARIAQLEGQQPSGAQGASFLGAGGPWGQRGQAQPQPQYQSQQQYQPQPAPPSGGGLFGGGLFGGGGSTQPGGFGSFLRSAGTTAAGVAGGSLLAEGLSGLFGGHHGGFGGGGFGGGMGGGFGGPEVENVTINEYGDQGDQGGYDGGGYDDGGSDDGNY
jgi:hypothetical protein